MSFFFQPSKKKNFTFSAGVVTRVSPSSHARGKNNTFRIENLHSNTEPNYYGVRVRSRYSSNGANGGGGRGEGDTGLPRSFLMFFSSGAISLEGREREKERGGDRRALLHHFPPSLTGGRTPGSSWSRWRTDANFSPFALSEMW